jgi:hypothetical protein
MEPSRQPAQSSGGLIPPSPSPRLAAALLIVVALLMIAGLALNPHPGTGTITAPGHGHDALLYERIVRDVAAGQSFYHAAPLALRQEGYPLRPFMAIRPPLLAVSLARLPDEAARRGVLAGLAGLTLAAWAWRLRGLWPNEPARYIWALTLLATGIAPALVGSAYLFHEVWAGLLIALSLALHRPRRWMPSLAVGLAVALLRELAIPYLAVMALFALWEGRRGEAAAWAAAIGVALAALGGHALAVAAVTTPLDPRSPGWLGLGGWPFVLRTAQWNSIVSLAPAWLAALLFPPALLGLLFAPGGLGRRICVIVLGFALGVCFVGRPDNSYWGLIVAPLWPLGLLAIDRAVKTLLSQAMRLRPSSANR